MNHVNYVGFHLTYYHDNLWGFLVSLVNICGLVSETTVTSWFDIYILFPLTGAPTTAHAMSTIMERSSDGSDATRMSQIDPMFERSDYNEHTSDPQEVLSDAQSPGEATTSLLSDDSEREITVPVGLDIGPDMIHDEPDIGSQESYM